VPGEADTTRAVDQHEVSAVAAGEPGGLRRAAPARDDARLSGRASDVRQRGAERRGRAEHRARRGRLQVGQR
jgi:hypothetical protein